ncbi:MAG: sulfatase-like hydrolase/transferase [Acidobacteria bacterium]|nr:sulfatase-like hydrolase/transferase [Acidobacteriota bacterium]
MFRAIAIIIGCSALISLAAPIVPPATQSGPNVLLVTIDTLRADRIGAYGHAGARTPTLDRLAREGVRFADATAHAPLTYPSHVAILTGRYPGNFGVRLNGMTPLPDAATTLAERMRTAGLTTGAVLASVILDKSSGLSQGFDDYDDAITGSNAAMVVLADLQRTAGAVTRTASGWIARQQSPWFLWVHYYDPHLPYAAPRASGRAATSDPYDAEVAYVDQQLGALLRTIDRTRTAIVVTADHGEALGEHGEDDHGYFIYDATLRVPLIVAAPGLTPRVVTEQVRSIDIAPTVAGLAGVPSDRAGYDGEDLQPLLKGGARRNIPVSMAESWYPRMHFGWSELRSARVGEWKFIAAPSPELYDLRNDPGEAKNVVRSKPQVGSRLAADLHKVTSGFSETVAIPAAQPDAETVARLQALGYVGTFAPVTASAGTVDPKDRVADYRAHRALFNRALGLLGRNQPAAAVPVLQRVLKTNVRAFETHLYLGNAYLMLERHDAALGEFDVAAQLNPGLATPHFEAGKALAGKRETAAAVARARKGLALEPLSFYGHYTLGVIQRRGALWVEAFESFSKAVDLNGGDPRARSGLAGVALRLGRLDVAAREFEVMVDLGYQAAPAHLNLGLIAERRGDRLEAGRRYRLALQVDPAFKPARDALAKLK